MSQTFFRSQDRRCVFADLEQNGFEPGTTLIDPWLSASPLLAEAKRSCLKELGLALLFVVLHACVSAPKATPDVEAAAKQFSTVPGKAQLYVVRPSSFGMAILYQVTVDGRLIGSLAAETFLLQTLDPGTHTISLFNSTSQENTTVTVEANENYFLRVGMNPATTSNRARFKLVSDEEGRQLVLTNTMVSSTPLR